MTRELLLPNSPLRVLSLFAGIGGIDLGLEAHGCQTVAYSEVDPYAASIMARHFPDAVNLGDITTIDWEAARELDIDIICGGFPCQDISTAGRGAGIAEGTRSGLWRHYADAVRVIRPRGVLVENVSALLARGLDRVLGDLAACGFDAEWDCIPASALGAPHRRDRLFLVAYPGSEGRRQDAGGAPGHESSHEGRPASDDHEPGRDGESGGPWLVADTDCERWREGRTRRAPSQGERRISAWPAPRRSEFWGAEPSVGRLAHGVPRRMDQLRCLGNAVVPQVAEHVAGILINRMEGAAHAA